MSVANLPSHTHSATTASHSHTQPTHIHSCTPTNSAGIEGSGKIAVGSEWVEGNLSFNTNAGGGDTTGSASPVTSIGSTGSGTAFSIMPPYLVINIWKRLS